MSRSIFWVSSAMTDAEVEDGLLRALLGGLDIEKNPERLRELCGAGLRASSRSCVALATLLRADRLRAFNDPRATLAQLDTLKRTSGDVFSGALMALLYEIKASEYLKLGSAIQALDCSLRAMLYPEKSIDVEMRCLRWIATCQLLLGEVDDAIIKLEQLCIGRLSDQISTATRCGILLQAAFARWVAAAAKDGRFRCFWTTAASPMVDVDSFAHHVSMMKKWLDAAGKPEFGTDSYFFLSLYRALSLAVENEHRLALQAMRTLLRELFPKDSYLAQRMTIETVMIARWGGDLELARALLQATPQLTGRETGLLGVMFLHEQLAVSVATGDNTSLGELTTSLLAAQSQLYIGVGALLQGAFDFFPAPECKVPKAIADLRDRFRSEQTIALPLSKLLSDSRVSRRAVELGFQKYLGRSPAEFRLAARLEVAKGLLKETQLGINEIAERVGFSSASALGVAYRRAYTKSPSDERMK